MNLFCLKCGKKKAKKSKKKNKNEFQSEEDDNGMPQMIVTRATTVDNKTGKTVNKVKMLK